MEQIITVPVLKGCCIHRSSITCSGIMQIATNRLRIWWTQITRYQILALYAMLSKITFKITAIQIKIWWSQGLLLNFVSSGSRSMGPSEQQQHHLRTCWKCKFSGLLNENSGVEPNKVCLLWALQVILFHATIWEPWLHTEKVYWYYVYIPQP